LEETEEGVGRGESCRRGKNLSGKGIKNPWVVAENLNIEHILLR